MPSPPPALDLIRELKGAESAAFREVQLRQLTKIYADSQRELLRTLNPAFNQLTDFKRARAEELLAQTGQILDSLDVQAREWAEMVVPISYDRGVQVAETQLRRLKIATGADTGALIHTQGVAVLADSLTADLVAGNAGTRNHVGRFIRRAQVVAAQDRQITRSIAAGLVRGETLKSTTDRLLKDLGDDLLSGSTVVINGRRFSSERYAELLARTRTREAVTEGTINTALQFDMDLIMVDVHDDPCPFCQQFSGRVYSISGEHPQFPPLERRAPFHPNCECTHHPVTEEHLKALGKFDPLVELSNDPSIPILGEDDYRRIIGPKATKEAKKEKKIRKQAASGFERPDFQADPAEAIKLARKEMEANGFDAKWLETASKANFSSIPGSVFDDTKNAAGKFRREFLSSLQELNTGNQLKGNAKKIMDALPARIAKSRKEKLVGKSFWADGSAATTHGKFRVSKKEMTHRMAALEEYMKAIHPDAVTLEAGLRMERMKFTSSSGRRVSWASEGQIATRLNSRPGADPGGGVFVHEMTHHLEYAHPEARARHRDWIKSGSKSTTFAQAQPDGTSKSVTKLKRVRYPHGRRDEMIFDQEDPGRAYDPYVFKDYGARATEVWTMGAQALVEDLDFRKLAASPDQVALLWATMRGY